MAYDTQATSNTPALIVYVLDVSVSMSNPLGGARRVDVVQFGRRLSCDGRA